MSFCHQCSPSLYANFKHFKKSNSKLCLFPQFVLFICTLHCALKANICTINTRSHIVSYRYKDTRRLILSSLQILLPLRCCGDSDGWWVRQIVVGYFPEVRLSFEMSINNNNRIRLWQLVGLPAHVQPLPSIASRVVICCSCCIKSHWHQGIIIMCFPIKSIQLPASLFFHQRHSHSVQQ